MFLKIAQENIFLWVVGIVQKVFNLIDIHCGLDLRDDLLMRAADENFVRRRQQEFKNFWFNITTVVAPSFKFRQSLL